ncbi:MAG: shikimate dehydrogenase [Deltaproteobacteria bacterium]|nr:shikimate dehydrogenase [Deltaproteobacteria bacterium]
MTLEIRGVKVGLGAPCYIVAEAGSNHNGSLPQALRLIDVAARAGASAVKFQTFQARRLYPRSAGTSDYLGDPTPIYDIIQAMEMPPAWLPTLRDHAHAAGLAFISSPFHEEAVGLLEPYVDAFKVASYELTHAPLLSEVCRTGKPLILSTGASTLVEVDRAVQLLRGAGCRELVLLQCTASYPTPLEAVNVRALVTLRETFGLPAGLSDHSRDPMVAPMVAAALGAAVIEKHFTLSNQLPGPDHPFAVEPDELARLVAAVRAVEQALGSGAKEVDATEEELRSFARRSIFTVSPVRAGEPFTRANVDVLRHGKLAAGLPPEQLGTVLASVAARDLPAEQVLTAEDLALADGAAAGEG